VHRTAGLVALYARRFDTAAASMRRSLELDPGSGVTRLMFASVLLEQGRHAEAGRVVSAVRDPELQDQRLSLLASAALRSGNRAAALRYREEASTLPGARSLVATARFAALLGTPEEVVATAARAVDDRTQLACALKVHPVFERVRNLPPFQALIRRVGLS
jgi:predicted Zn-dependent protease